MLTNAPSIFITNLYDGHVVTLDADAVNHGALEVGDKDPIGTVLCPQLLTAVRFLNSLRVLDDQDKIALFSKGV